MISLPKKVLVVDDEAIVRDSYERVLTAAGYAVTPVPSGREALAACRSEPFDTMVADLRMPDMDGMEVTRTVRNEFPHMPVIIATGYPTPESAVEAQKLGVFDYLQKPLAPDRLSAATAAALSWPMGQVLTDSFVPRLPAALDAVVDTAIEIAKDTAVEVETKELGTVYTLGMLVLAPLMGLAYVIFLPLIGFGMLLALVAQFAGKKLGLANATRAGKDSE